ncbi:hypothetical protein A2Z00_04750 [Candidatus Gottesmanbacteria bacterium RBG_13_45_10]|uniref:Uncharacterized protein n=1 Tax=Candidatus Gottesmanbacteria bacterium RBG_13_45_10 TaxID=1798370 RepID=A0A1F5ZG91_9BACT|nr:MAG: hypothetical protein A2Z00_04750 [Candidatus Gottesmanbacteria bacterium RBG_13_45_10]
MPHAEIYDVRYDGIPHEKITDEMGLRKRIINAMRHIYNAPTYVDETNRSAVQHPSLIFVDVTEEKSTWSYGDFSTVFVLNHGSLISAYYHTQDGKVFAAFLTGAVPNETNQWVAQALGYDLGSCKRIGDGSLVSHVSQKRWDLDSKPYELTYYGANVQELPEYA